MQLITYFWASQQRDGESTGMGKGKGKEREKLRGRV